MLQQERGYCDCQAKQRPKSNILSPPIPLAFVFQVEVNSGIRLWTLNFGRWTWLLLYPFQDVDRFFGWLSATGGQRQNGFPRIL